MNDKGLDTVMVRLVPDRRLYSDIKISEPIDAIRLIGKELSDMDRESIWILNLQSDNRVINASMISVGVVDSTTTTPREIVKASILSNASNMILIHNHPSGSLNPSEFDKKLTRRLVEATDLIGINLLDHIIVGAGNDKNFFSMNGEEMMPYTCDNYFRYKNNIFTKESITIANIEPDKPIVISNNQDSINQGVAMEIANQTAIPTQEPILEI